MNDRRQLQIAGASTAANKSVVSENRRDEKHPNVSIIIVNWNRQKDVIECLESLRRLDYPNCHVIVVDNASTDGSQQSIKKAFPEVVLINNEINLGYTGGNNVGIRYALQHNAEYVWLLNNDTIVEPQTLAMLTGTAEGSAEIGMVSPIVYFYDQPDKVQLSCWYFDLENRRFTEKLEARRNNNTLLGGTALLIKRAVIEKIGCLDERFFAYYEDFEYSVRSFKAGYRNALEPTAKIFHKAPVFEDMCAKRPAHYYYYMIRNEYLFWSLYIRGMRRISYVRRHAADAIVQAASYKELGFSESMNASLDGLWSAWLGVHGAWDRSVRMPTILKRIVLWRSHFWADLLMGRFRKILREVARRVRRKLTSYLPHIPASK
jgi:GT2 family glycosyltransferase